jgi:hypothetical protein
MNTTKTSFRTDGPLRAELLTLDFLNSNKCYVINSKFRSVRVQVFHPYGTIFYMCETVTKLIKVCKWKRCWQQLHVRILQAVGIIWTRDRVWSDTQGRSCLQRQAVFRNVSRCCLFELAISHSRWIIPVSDLLMAILLPSSRFHLTFGGGDPVAWHVRVTLAPSRTITSELLWESSMLGGTVTKGREHEW